jgi:TonB family protein
VAILGLNPANVPQIPRPEGSRPARIDAGTPVPGATRAELGGGNSSVSLPDVSIQGGAPTSPAVATRSPLDNQLGEPATGLARPRAPEVLPTTPHVSVPQWPSSRHLPAAVEHHFQNRVVYTTLIPSAQSSDDWIVWFSEVEIVATDANMVMHPPILLKAGFLPPILAHNDHGTGNIRLTGIIHKDGHLTSLTALAGGAADRELVEALQAWQFSPARRNGVIIDADAVIEIPVVFGKLSLR